MIPGLYLNLCSSRLDAFEIGQARAVGREFCFLDDHVGYIILDREPNPTLRTNQHVTLMLEGNLAHGTNQQRQELIAYHRMSFPRLAGLTLIPFTQESTCGRSTWHYLVNAIAGEVNS